MKRFAPAAAVVIALLLAASAAYAKQTFRGEVVLLESGSVMVKNWNVEKAFVTGPDLELAWKDSAGKGPLGLCQRVAVEYVAEGGKLRAVKIIIEKQSDCCE